MNLSPIQAALALVAIGFKERDAIKLLEEIELDPLHPEHRQVISEERLRAEIEEWSVRKPERKK